MSQHPAFDWAMDWLDGEVELGPRRDRGHALQIRLVIETGDTSHVTTESLTWLGRKAKGHTWRQQANICLDIIEDIDHADTIINPEPLTIPCPPPDWTDGEVAA